MPGPTNERKRSSAASATPESQNAISEVLAPFRLLSSSRGAAQARASPGDGAPTERHGRRAVAANAAPPSGQQSPALAASAGELPPDGVPRVQSAPEGAPAPAAEHGGTPPLDRQPAAAARARRRTRAAGERRRPALEPRGVPAVADFFSSASSPSPPPPAVGVPDGGGAADGGGGGDGVAAVGRDAAGVRARAARRARAAAGVAAPLALRAAPARGAVPHAVRVLRLDAALLDPAPRLLAPHAPSTRERVRPVRPRPPRAR